VKYVLLGYGATVGTLGIYALRVVFRGRALARRARPVATATADQ